MKSLTTVAATILLAAAASAHAGPKLYLFDCGSIRFDDVSDFGLTNDETDVRELFVPCYLIEKDGKRLFWDGGLPLSLVGQGPQAMEGAVVEYERSVLDQLANLGVSPGDVHYAAYSHFHLDHIGAANAFLDATLLINAAEYDAAFLHPEDNSGFDFSLYGDLKDTARVILTEDHDVFGDGTVTIIPAPGHTPGHQVLLIKLENTGPMMLSGDLYHFEFSRRNRRTPKFNADKAQTLQSIDKIEARLEAEGATLWIEHNKALADTLKKAPAFHD